MKTSTVLVGVLTGLLFFTVFDSTVLAESGPRLPADQTKQCQAVVDTLLKAGFPDAKGATVYTGTLHVSATFDPTKDAPQLPSDSSNSQMTSNTALVTYGYEFEGLHFKLADGSWLIAMRFHFSPGKDDKVDTADAKQVDLSKLSSDADANPFDAEGKAEKWLDAEVPANRKLAAAAMNRYIPVNQTLMLQPDDEAPAAVLLWRAGYTDALDMSIVTADQRARHYWQIRPWEEAEFSFDPTGEYPQAKTAEADWKKAHTQYTMEAPDVALRRAMFRWCRAQMMVLSPEDAMLAADVAAASTRGMIDPKDPQHNLENVDLIVASNKLPVTPAEKATVAERLQSWEARQRMPKMVVTGGGNNGGNTASISTAFVAPTPAYVPATADLDELVKLLDDDRPSRFRDFGGGRTLGDNAWRAMAMLLKSDPRTLAAYPTDNPWTTKERHTAAAAVQAWWKAHRGEYLDKK